MGDLKTEIEVQEPWWSWIQSGAKTVEGRTGPCGKFDYLVGKSVTLTCPDPASPEGIKRLTMPVGEVRFYPNLDEYLQQEWNNAAPTAESLEEARAMYRAIIFENGEQVFSPERVTQRGGINAVVFTK